MTLIDVFQLAFVLCGSAVTIMLVAIAVTKGVRSMLDERTARSVAVLRPIVLAALDEDEPLVELTSRQTRVAADIATALLPKLRGSDRKALAGMLIEQGVIPQAVSGLRSRSAPRRQRAAELLGNAGHTPVERELVRLLHDRDTEVRATAARALGKVGAPESVEALLVALGERKVPANTASMAVLRIGADGAQPIRAALASPVPIVRSTAAELSGSLGLMEGRSTIESLLDDSDPTVRLSAARALGRLSHPLSASTLIRRLEAELDRAHDSANEEFLTAIVVALGRIGHRSAIPVLEASLSRRRRLSAAVAVALSGMGVRRPISSSREPARPPQPVGLTP